MSSLATSTKYTHLAYLLRVVHGLVVEGVGRGDLVELVVVWRSVDP